MDDGVHDVELMDWKTRRLIEWLREKAGTIGRFRLTLQWSIVKCADRRRDAGLSQ